jgi:SpoVK/Ycf46/Vps4 family AAA+-type ATPase
LVFHNAARKVIKNGFKHAHLESITYYYTQVLKQGMDTKDAHGLHLTKEYLQGKVDRLLKDPLAFEWMCGWWVSPEFQAISDQNRVNRRSKQGLHRYGADGHVKKT